MSARVHRPTCGVVGMVQRAAVRRWPAHLRDEQSREWTAELDTLRGEPRSGIRRLGFVLSLALGPTPWTRPTTVTVAVRLLYLLAAVQVVGLVLQLSQARTIVDATAAAYWGTGDEESVSIIVTTAVGAVLAGLFTIAYLVLAVLNGRGNAPARVAIRVIGGIGVFCGAFTLVDSGFRAGLIVWGETPEGTDAVTVQRHVTAALPSWYVPSVATLGVIALLTVLAVIVLLALPPSNEFFRSQPLGGYPGPGGGHAPSDNPSPPAPLDSSGAA